MANEAIWSFMIAIVGVFKGKHSATGRKGDRLRKAGATFDPR
jgi:hypothetical protein